MNEPVSQPVSRLQAPFLPFPALNPSLTFPQWCSLIWKSKTNPPFPSQACFWAEIFSHTNRMKLELADGARVQAFLLLSAWCYQWNLNSLRSIISVVWWHREGTRVSSGSSLPVMMIIPPLTWLESGLFAFLCGRHTCCSLLRISIVEQLPVLGNTTDIN